MIDETAALLPRVRITELLLEVDGWTDFTRHFTHLKSGDVAKDKTLLLTTILADAINLGLSKMAESCPGFTYAKLSCFEQQRHRAGGLNLVTAAIVLWNTVYLERATRALQHHGAGSNTSLLRYLSPLGWEHINLTGDYVWKQNRAVLPGKFCPLRARPQA